MILGVLAFRGFRVLGPVWCLGRVQDLRSRCFRGSSGSRVWGFKGSRVYGF